MPKPMGKRVFGLDLMRATAISLVVFSHISWLLPFKSGLLVDLMSIAGVIGVEIFFVLSGFLIGRIIYKFFVSEDFHSGDIKYFWIRRWFRTIPNYFLGLMWNLIVLLALGFSIPDGIWKYVLFIQNFSSGIPVFFYESWTLSIEEFAYLIGPIIIYLFYLFRRNGNRSRQFLYMVICIILMCTVLRLIYNANQEIRDMEYWNLNLKAVVIYRLDAVYYGALAAYLSLVWPGFWKRSRFVLFFLGVCLFIVLNLLPVAQGILIESYPAFWNVWYLPLNSVAIMLTLPLLSNWHASSNVMTRLITGLSLISYAIYVLHYSIIMQVMRHVIPNEQFIGIDLLIYIVVYLTAVLLSSYLLYKVYEKPMTDLRDHPKIIDRFRLKRENNS
ncbi:MAG: acyltransferase [Flavobacteriaceae bacterium]|nr:acyltransferase [Flavobacteriaceae bacterium]